jgi:uncharacterized protein with PQ loop repeat
MALQKAPGEVSQTSLPSEKRTKTMPSFIKQSLGALATVIGGSLVMATAYAALYVLINPQSYFSEFGNSFPQQLKACLSLAKGLILWFVPWVLLSGIARYTFLPPSLRVWKLKNMVLLGTGGGALVAIGYIVWLFPSYHTTLISLANPTSLMGIALILAVGSIMGLVTGCLVGLAARWFKRVR